MPSAQGMSLTLSTLGPPTCGRSSHPLPWALVRTQRTAPKAAGISSRSRRPQHTSLQGRSRSSHTAWPGPLSAHTGQGTRSPRPGPAPYWQPGLCCGPCRGMGPPPRSPRPAPGARCPGLRSSTHTLPRGKLRPTTKHPLGAPTCQELSPPLPGAPWRCLCCGNTGSMSGCGLFAVRELRVQGRESGGQVREA